MGDKQRKGRKVRVEFRQNRQERRRSDDWTHRYRSGQDELIDERSSETVRPKGELSRKRTILVDDDAIPLVDEANWKRGVVLGVFGLVCRVQTDSGEEWDCTVRRVLRTRLIEQRAPVSCGDRVWFSDQSAHLDGERAGVIERVEPRRGVLSRRERRGREHTIVANVDQLLIVASVAQPSLKPHLIDRYLVAAAKGDLRPIICLNKWDLLEDAPAPPPAPAKPRALHSRGGNRQRRLDVEPDEDGILNAPEALPGLRSLTPDEVIAEFERLGYRCIRTSAARGLGLDELRNELAGHSTVLSGQSGVGKSSLLNGLQPGLGLAVREVSDQNEKGRHTTTHARLLRLDGGGYVVDTPGIRQFDIWDVTPGELEGLFVEFAERVAGCLFRDCHHVHEEGCAIRAAVAAGEISPRRYESYCKMLEELSREQRE